MATPRTLAAEAAPPSLWDPVVRLTHWGIAVSVLVNAALNEGGSLLHVSLGWLVMALVDVIDLIGSERAAAAGLVAAGLGVAG